MKLKPHLKLGITANINVIRDGKRIPMLKNQRNLILDTGMADIGQRGIGQFQTYCHWGDDNAANSLDSGTTTASRSGSTVTASGNIFSASDVGALIKWDSGEEAYIQTFTSATEIETQDSGTIGSGEFTIWYVDQTALKSEVQRTSSTQGTNGPSLSAGVITITATHIFSAVSGSETVREIGWGHENSGTVGSRVVIAAPISLVAGDQLEVESNFEIVQNYQTPTAIDPTTGEGNFAGDVQIEGVGIDNYSSSWTALEPSNAPELYVLDGDSAFNSYGTVKNVNSITHSEFSATDSGSAPVAPPWQRTKQWALTTAQANTTIEGLAFGSDALGSNQSNLRLRLTTPQAKTSLQSLTIAMTVSWDRNLSN